MSKRVYKCEWCGQRIPEVRVYAALSRGQVPRYDTNTCRGNANTAAYRQNKKQQS